LKATFELKHQLPLHKRTQFIPGNKENNNAPSITFELNHKLRCIAFAHNSWYGFSTFNELPM